MFERLSEQKGHGDVWGFREEGEKKKKKIKNTPSLKHLNKWLIDGGGPFCSSKQINVKRETLKRETCKLIDGGRVMEIEDDFWTVEDVMDYFGEELGTEEEAKRVMKMVKKTNGYFGAMNEIRSILMLKELSVPFRAVYRRVKRRRTEK